MTLHDDPRLGPGPETGKPCAQDPVQALLADSDGWIRPQCVKLEIGWQVLGPTKDDVGQPVALGIPSSGLEGRRIHVHAPHVRLRRKRCHGQGEGADPAADVEQITRRGRRRDDVEEHARPGVESPSREGTARRGEPERATVELDRELGPRARRRRSLGEVLLTVHVVGILADVQQPTDTTRRGETIRTFGDPVLKTVAAQVSDVDGKLVSLTERMFTIMYEAPGIGLAAPQIGIQKQVFVWDIDDDPRVILNPTIVESSGEWVYEEGCLSIPGVYVEIVRPRNVLVRGVTLEGTEIEFEADDLLARLFQHEIDHLNGVLMFERMPPEQRKAALAAYRRRETAPAGAPAEHVALG